MVQVWALIFLLMCCMVFRKFYVPLQFTGICSCFLLQSHLNSVVLENKWKVKGINIVRRQNKNSHSGMVTKKKQQNEEEGSIRQLVQQMEKEEHQYPWRFFEALKDTRSEENTLGKEKWENEKDANSMHRKWNLVFLVVFDRKPGIHLKGQRDGLLRKKWTFVERENCIVPIILKRVEGGEWKVTFFSCCFICWSYKSRTKRWAWPRLTLEVLLTFSTYRVRCLWHSLTTR